MTSAGCTLIDGERVEDVYSQLVATVEATTAEIENVMCRLACSPDMSQIARLYLCRPNSRLSDTPAGAGDMEPARLSEFRELAKWWQIPSAPRSPLEQQFFTHGSRIRTYDGYFDQVEHVVEAFRVDPKTSRGIVVLLNPPSDRIS